MNYKQEIQQLVENMVEEVIKYNDDVETATEAVEHIRYNCLDHEYIDGHQWIIYTAYHDQILQNTNNYDAYLEVYCQDDLGQLVSDGGEEKLTMMKAFYAMFADVNDELCKVDDDK